MKRLNQHNRRSNQQGIAMLLALLLMSALTAAGIGASTVIISEIRTSSSTDAGIAAYYAADAGLERALFTIANSRMAGIALGNPNGLEVNTAFNMVKNQLPAPASLLNAGTVDMTDSSILQSQKTVSLQKDQAVQLELYGSTSDFSPTVVRSLELQSSTVDPANGGWIEVSWSFVKKTGSLGVNPPNTTVRLITANNLLYGVKIDLVNGTITSSHALDPITTNIFGSEEVLSDTSNIGGWSVRIKAFVGNPGVPASTGIVPDLTIKTRDPADVIMKIPGDFALIARGDVNGAKARIDAIIPWKFPVSALFDYVVFSENSLDKNGI